jgi:hypothetical protein
MFGLTSLFWQGDSAPLQDSAHLAAGKKFERARPVFRANTTTAKLRQLLGLPEAK